MAGTVKRLLKDGIGLMLILTIFIFFGGCNFDESNTATIAVLAEMAARNVGYEVGKMGDDRIDRTLRNIYSSIKAGDLTEGALLQLADLTKARPTLAPDIASLIKLFGVKQADGSLLIRAVPAEVLQGLETGYSQGVLLGRRAI